MYTWCVRDDKQIIVFNMTENQARRISSGAPGTYAAMVDPQKILRRKKEEKLEVEADSLADKEIQSILSVYKVKVKNGICVIE